jgi:hypothetical protein
VGQFGGAGFDDYFALGKVVLLEFELRGASLKLGLAFFEPVLSVFEFGIEVGFLRSDLDGAAIETVAILLEAIGEFGGMLAQLIDRVLDEIGATGGGRELSGAGELQRGPLADHMGLTAMDRVRGIEADAIGRSLFGSCAI